VVNTYPNPIVEYTVGPEDLNFTITNRATHVKQLCVADNEGLKRQYWRNLEVACTSVSGGNGDFGTQTAALFTPATHQLNIRQDWDCDVSEEAPL
jgi:hypothetical protein